jgi:hypothetical protein
MGSIEDLERQLTRTPEDEEARRKRARELLAELTHRLDRAAQAAALDDGTQGAREDGFRDVYRQLYSREIGDEEYESREALRIKYGAVSLAPLLEQQALYKF